MGRRAYSRNQTWMKHIPVIILLTLFTAIAVPAAAQQPGGLKPQNPASKPSQLQKPGETKQANEKPIGQAVGAAKNANKGLPSSQQDPAVTHSSEQTELQRGKTPFLRRETLIDYRQVSDPGAQRQRRTLEQAPVLFGYTYFEPARQAIDAYRLRFRRLLGDDFPGPRQPEEKLNGQGSEPVGEGTDRKGNAEDQSRSAPRIPTKSELDALNRLTDAQRSDLRQRAQLGKLTAEEKDQFGHLLDSKSLVESATLNVRDDDLSSTLTDAQKLDLLIRLRDNLLTDEEKRRYKKFLFGSKTTAKPPVGVQQGEEETVVQGGQTAPAQISSRRPSVQEPLQAPTPFDAFRSVAGPLQLLYQNISASAPTNYQLAPGDRITYRYSSPTREARELTVDVDSTGGMSVPDIGRVVVRGQTLTQAETALQNRLERFYRGAQVSLSLKELRTIPVTITGESYAPGTYVVPAVASAFNMVYATGGPTDDGSLRQIQVLRHGKTVGVIDYYKFILTGDQTADIPLETGDVIYIPPRTGHVTVTGEVRRSAVFELIPNESLRDALMFAGGVKPSGVSQRVQVATLQPGASRLLKDVDITQAQSASNVPVYDGDIVEVFSVRGELTNVVTVEGAVDVPGPYAAVPGMTVADLIGRARGLLTEAYPTLAHLYRWNIDNTLTLVPINLEKALKGDLKENVTIQRWDRLTVYTREEISWTGRRDVTVRGAVKNAGIYYRSDNMRVRDLLLLAGGTAPEAFMDRAYLLRQNPDGTFAYETLDLNLAMRDDPKHNAAIQDHDILAIYRTDEARFSPDRVVEVHGEANAPGIYPRGEKMKLSDVIGIAGGLTAKAGKTILLAHARRTEGEEPVRITFDMTAGLASPDPVLQDGDVITIQGRGDIEDRPAIVNVSGAVNRPGPVLLRGPRVRLSEVIKEAGGLKPEAFPEGVEFTRNPEKLATNRQRQIMDLINRLNNILNQADYKTALAASDLEKARAIGEAIKGSSQISIPGMSVPEQNVSSAALNATATALNSRELVSQPRTLNIDDLAPKGSVAVNLASAMLKPGGHDDMLMVDGDTITVPTRPTTVQVIGAVMESRGVLFREEATLAYYLEHAGGYTRDAARDRILVIRLGGGLQPVQKVKRFLPGDVIMVPTKPMVAVIQKRRNDFDQLFRSLTNGALVVLVAKKLLGL